jgi:hypothetical protein
VTNNTPALAFAALNIGASLTGDGITNALGVVANTTNQKVEIMNNGTSVGTRKTVNFIPGTNVTYTIADNGGSDRVDVTINSSGGGGSASAAGTTGQVQFNGGSSTFAADAALYWDNSNKRLGVGSGVGTTINTGLDIKTDMATREYNYTTSLSGTNNDVNFDAAGNQFGLIRLATASADFTITSLAGAANGKRITIYNATTKNMTLVNKSGSGTNGNHFLTGSGSNVMIQAGGSASIVYSATDTTWLVCSTSQANSSVPLTTSIGGTFFKKNIAGTGANQIMDLNPAGGFSIQDYVMPYAGSVIAIAAKTNVAQNGGASAAVFNVYINGVQKTLTATIQAGATNNVVATQNTGIDTFVAGDRISVEITTTNNFNPTDGEAVVYVHIN